MILFLSWFAVTSETTCLDGWWPQHCVLLDSAHSFLCVPHLPHIMAPCLCQLVSEHRSPQTLASKGEEVCFSWEERSLAALPQAGPHTCSASCMPFILNTRLNSWSPQGTSLPSWGDKQRYKCVVEVVTCSGKSYTEINQGSWWRLFDGRRQHWIGLVRGLLEGMALNWDLKVEKEMATTQWAGKI